MATFRVLLSRAAASPAFRDTVFSRLNAPIARLLPPLAPLAAPRRWSAAAALPPAAAAASPSAPTSHLADLSAEQLEAVTGPLVPTRVVAGPGSGKTRVLTARIAHLISAHGVRPWQIVAITFTNKAATEMRERLAATLGPVAASELFAGTFHSLCYRILRRSLVQTLPDAGRTDNWNLYDQEAALAVIYRLVREAHPEWKSGEARTFAKRIQSRISAVKNALDAGGYGMTPAEAVDAYIAAKAGEAGPTPGQLAGAADTAEWLTQYDAAMREANAVDFDDLLGLTVAALKRDVELRRRLRRRWRHVLVDEFQDTNGPQYALVRLLAAPESDDSSGDGAAAAPGHLFAVGDPDQAIYGWRGADVRNMKHYFGQDFPNSQIYRLRDNYRSSPGILAAAQAVIARNDWDATETRPKLRAMRSPGPPIRVTSVEDAYEEAELVAAEAASLVRSGAVRDRDIAVLFRTHMQARLVEQELVKRGLSYVLVGGVPFWRRVEIQDVLAYLRLAATLEDDVALLRVINVPKRGLGDASLAKLNAAAEAAGTSLSRLLFGPPVAAAAVQLRDAVKNGASLPESVNLEPLPEVKAALSGKAAAAVESLRAAVAIARAAVERQPLSTAIQRIVAVVGYEDHVLKGGCGGNDDDIEERLQRVRQLAATAAEFRPGTAAGAAALDAAFAALDAADDGSDLDLDAVEARIAAFITATSTDSSSSSSSSSDGALDNANSAIPPETRVSTAQAFLDEAALYSGADEGTDVDGVRLTTCHAAKGLEHEVVFIPGCVEGLMPLYDPDRGGTEEDLEEETRLFFVALTRAKRELRLFHTRMNAHQGPANRRPNKPSRFLRDVMASGHAEGVEMSGARGNWTGAGPGRAQRYAPQGRAPRAAAPRQKAAAVKKEVKPPAPVVVEEPQKPLSVAQKRQQRRTGRR